MSESVIGCMFKSVDNWFVAEEFRITLRSTRVISATLIFKSYNRKWDSLVFCCSESSLSNYEWVNLAFKSISSNETICFEAILIKMRFSS